MTTFTERLPVLFVQLLRDYVATGHFDARMTGCINFNDDRSDIPAINSKPGEDARQKCLLQEAWAAFAAASELTRALLDPLNQSLTASLLI